MIRRANTSTAPSASMTQHTAKRSAFGIMLSPDPDRRERFGSDRGFEKGATHGGEVRTGSVHGGASSTVVSTTGSPTEGSEAASTRQSPTDGDGPSLTDGGSDRRSDSSAAIPEQAAQEIFRTGERWLLPEKNEDGLMDERPLPWHLGSTQKLASVAKRDWYKSAPSASWGVKFQSGGSEPSNLRRSSLEEARRRARLTRNEPVSLLFTLRDACLVWRKGERGFLSRDSAAGRERSATAKPAGESGSPHKKSGTGTSHDTDNSRAAQQTVSGALIHEGRRIGWLQQGGWNFTSVAFSAFNLLRLSLGCLFPVSLIDKPLRRHGRLSHGSDCGWQD